MSKVLHVSTGPSFSGAESYALQTAISQMQLGHEVHIFTAGPTPLFRKAQAAQIQAHIRWPTNDYDVLHLHSTQELKSFWWRIAVQRLTSFSASEPNKRRSLIVLQPHIWIDHSKRDPLHRIPYSFVDLVLASSRPHRETLERNLPVTASKIALLRYGRDLKKIQTELLDRAQARAALKLPDNALVIGAVGRIDAGKGTREFVAAAEALASRNPRLHFIWIGSPTSDDPKAIQLHAELTEKLGQSPVRSQIHLPGSIADSFKYLRAFDLNVLATYKECFALSLLEAMAAGIPSIATRAGGSPEVIRDGHTGWLFEPQSTPSLISTISRALDEVDEWPRLAQKSQELVRAQHDLPLVQQALDDLLRDRQRQLWHERPTELQPPPRDEV